MCNVIIFITLSFAVSNFVREDGEHLFFSLSSDIKRTQWEDPRLQNAAITGPVSLFVSGSSDGVVPLPVSSRAFDQGHSTKGVERKAHLQISPLPTAHTPGLSYLKRAYKVIILTLRGSLVRPVSQIVKC